MHTYTRLHMYICIYGSTVKNLPAVQETQETPVGSRAGKIPWRSAWRPTLVFLPGESHGQGSLRATFHRVAQSWTALKWLSTVYV